MARRQANRRRLDSEARHRQLLDLAGDMVLKQGYLPLSLIELGKKAGVSKALIYTHFPSQYHLFNALARRQVQLLAESGLAAAPRAPSLDQAVLKTAEIYFAHVAEHGPLLHVILRDLYMAGHVAPDVASFRNAVIGRLARRGFKQLKLNTKEAIAAASLIITIPEEAGRLVFEREMRLPAARTLCLDLVSSAVAAIVPLQRSIIR